jgi:hypothetical protein
MLVRKQWLAVGILFVLLLVLFGSGNQNLPVGLLPAAFEAGIFIFVMLRFGLLPLAVTFLFSRLLMVSPIFLDLSLWYARNTLVATGLLVGLLVYGFRISLGGRPALGGGILQD